MKEVDVAVLQMSTSMELTYLQQVRTHGMRSGAETSMSESRSSEWTQTSRFVERSAILTRLSRMHTVDNLTSSSLSCHLHDAKSMRGLLTRPGAKRGRWHREFGYLLTTLRLGL